MTVTVTVKPRTKLIVPTSVRRQAGIKAGDRLEFKVSGGVIAILPKLPAISEYTAEQRRIISARLAEAEKGPFHGPFTAKQAAAFMRQTLKARSVKRKQPE